MDFNEHSFSVFMNTTLIEQIMDIRIYEEKLLHQHEDLIEVALILQQY
jgi:hypothetical protein